MTTDGKPPGTEHEEDDAQLWRLLERAPRPKPVSPYFARRVLREVASLEEVRAASSRGPRAWLGRVWQVWRWQAGAPVACAVFAVALLLAGGANLSSPRWHTAAPVVVASDVNQGPAEVVARVDVSPSPSVAVASDSAVTAQDVEVIADLDNVLSREESRLWTEDDTARF